MTKPTKAVQLGAVAVLLLGFGEARAEAPAHPEFLVVEIEYKGTQEHPVYPICIGNSKESVTWCASQFCDEEGHLCLETKTHVEGSQLLTHIISDIPSAQSNRFSGVATGKEVEITIVDHGARRRVYLKGDGSEALLRKFISDSADDPALRHDLLEFRWRVDAYAGERHRAPD